MVAEPGTPQANDLPCARNLSVAPRLRPKHRGQRELASLGYLNPPVSGHRDAVLHTFQASDIPSTEAGSGINLGTAWR